MCDCNPPNSNARELIEKCKQEGISDPEIKCHVHGVTRKLSELSPIALLALEEGIDTDADLTCLLAD